MLKFIFLDIDGVLNIVNGKNGIKDSTYFRIGEHIEPSLMKNFNEFLDKNDSISIVISSSWRDDMEDLYYVLDKNNFKHLNKIVGHTSLNFEFRGEQIEDYLVKNNIDNYVIIDDCMYDMLENKDKNNEFILKHKCLLVDPKKGLNIDKIRELEKLIQEKRC
jgi:hypothetical protein